MSVAVRVIPCLDVSEGRVVKGVNFVGLVDAGDPVELARRYDEEGADEPGDDEDDRGIRRGRRRPLLRPGSRRLRSSRSRRRLWPRRKAGRGRS